jgi:hypothetical protein
VVLAVIGIWAYAKGRPYQAFRATDNAQNVCGLLGTPTADYPYAYLFNPKSTNNRICVKQCPLYEDGKLKNVECYNGSTNTCTYGIIVKEDGSFDGSILGSEFIGYGSYSILGRFCLPELKVLNNAFSSYSTLLSEKFKTSYLNHFISDIQNVPISFYSELVLGFVGIRIYYYHCIHYDVPYAMDCSSSYLGQHHCHPVHFYRFWAHLPLPWRRHSKQ